MKRTRRMRALLGAGLALAGAWLLSGCATTGRVFSPGGYGAESVGLRQAVISGEPSRQLAAAEKAEERAQRGDEVLYRLEEGRLRLLAGDLDGAIRALQVAVDLFELERQQATLRITEGFFAATALATNDRALPYESAGYERLMAHNLLALAYLRRGDPERAAIALNGAVAEMDFLRDKAAKFRSARERKAANSGVNDASLETATASIREQLRAEARPGLQPYHNAFTFYLQSLLFAQNGDRERAEIALRRAAELAPGNPSILAALEQDWRPRAEEALVVIISQNAVITPKSAIQIPFFWNGVILQVAMPVYEGRYGEGGADAFLVVDGGTRLQPALITDLGAQARQELADRYPGIFLRQVLRLIAKYQMQRELEKKDPWAGLAAQIFNLLTDQADTRSWSTLPASIAVAHGVLPPGTHTLAWGDRTGVSEGTPVELAPGDLLILFLNQTTGAFTQDWVHIDASGAARQSVLSSEPQTSNTP